MNFSFRNIIIAITVALLGLAFFLSQNILLSLDGSSNKQDTLNTQDTPENLKGANPATERKKSAVNKQSKTGNAAADGLSNFYEKVYGSAEEGGVEIINNVVYLPDPKGNLEELLKARALVVRPFSKNWIGTNKSRPFRKGNTIYEMLAEYSQEDRLEVIWWVNRDFVIKDDFRIHKNTIDMAYQLSIAIAGNFEGGIYAFFCHEQRSLIIIDEDLKYLRNNCTLLRSSKN